MARSRTGHLDVTTAPDVSLRALYDAVCTLAKPETVQIVDWGKRRKNVDQILSHLQPLSASPGATA